MNVVTWSCYHYCRLGHWSVSGRYSRGNPDYAQCDQKCKKMFFSEFAPWNATYLEIQSHPTSFFLFCFCLFQGGLSPGGFNFDAKLSVLLYLNVLTFLFVGFIFFSHFLYWTICRRRESTDVEDLFIAHIAGMDTLARGLRNAVKLIEVTQDQFTSIYALIIQMRKFNENL